MRVLHVITSLSRSSGGPARSVQGLVAAECAAGVDAWVWPINGGDPWIADVRKVAPPPSNSTSNLNLFLKSYSLVHIHGIWSPQLHKVAVACRRANIPYVIAPRGMLEPWSLRQKWLKKRIARFLYQDRDLKCAAALHATAESEAEQFRALGFKNYVIVSPNGVNVPEGKLESRVGVGERNLRRALFVSRMHPKKGVFELVESWSRVKPQGWQCELVYTLNGDEEKAYEQQVKDRILALGMSYQDKKGDVHSPTPTQNSNFILTGALGDDKKWEAYARADLFILPTYSENFGIVIAEALYAGVPVITTKGTPWSDLLGSNSNNPNNSPSRCGWWIDLPAEEEVKGQRSEVKQWRALDSALREACGAEGLRALPAMGENGRRLVEQKYLWSAVVQPLLRDYEYVLEKW